MDERIERLARWLHNAFLEKSDQGRQRKEIKGDGALWASLDERFKASYLAVARELIENTPDEIFPSYTVG